MSLDVFAILGREVTRQLGGRGLQYRRVGRIAVESE
jgi:hypothetical protein